MKRYALIYSALLSVLPAQQALDLAKLDAHAAAVMRAFHVPGMAVCVVQGDEVLVAKGYGMRDMATDKRVDGDTLFAIGSSSKAFTALGVALLVEEGRVAWRDPVRKHLPGFRMQDEYASRHLSVEDLLCHRSGLPRHDMVWYGSSRSREELVGALRWLKPNRQLRSAWQYQNLMFATAGYLVGQLSGATWEQFTQKRILDPLGMKRSNFSVEKMRQDENAALPYRLVKDRAEKLAYRNIDAIGPAGSINSSARDMARWLRMLIGDGALGGTRVAKKTTIADLSRPRMTMGRRGGREFGYLNYGLGWMVQTYRGHLMVHHGGNIDGFSALVTYFPDDDLGVVVLSNLGANRSTVLIPRWVADRVLGLSPIDWLARAEKARARSAKVQAQAVKKKSSGRVSGTKPSRSLAAYAGRFEHRGYGRFRVRLVKGRLEARFNGLDMPLDHFHYDVFEVGAGLAKGTKVQFHSNRKGEIDSVSAKLEAQVDAIEFARAAAQRLRDPAFLDRLTGRYRLAAAPQTITIELKGSTLHLTVPGQPTYECEPRSGLRFGLKGLKGYSVVFELGKVGGKAAAIELDQPNGVFAAKRIGR